MDFVRGNGPHPRPVGHPLSMNGDGEIDARVAGVMDFAREIDARDGGRCGFGEWLGMDGAWRWTGNVDEREDTIG